MDRQISETRQIPAVLQEMLRSGLALLWRSYEYTLEVDPEGWEFAVEESVLFRSGLSDIDLRWMMTRGYLECATKTRQSESQNGLFRKTAICEKQDAHFLLTEAGAAFALDVISRPVNPDLQMPSLIRTSVKAAELFDMAAGDLNSGRQKPRWDRDRRELRCGEWVIKQFRWAAVNQETILMAFEEEEWPTRIDDPLPQKLDQDPKCRLHDTIKCLNRNHRKRVIRFNGDGTGEGILWTFLNGDEPDA